MKYPTRENVPPQPVSAIIESAPMFASLDKSHLCECGHYDFDHSQRNILLRRKQCTTCMCPQYRKEKLK